MSSEDPAVRLVPTRFVWPHGGRRIYLCGSFTRWQDAQPMAPIDGCLSVFQVVVDLPPGYHQYKFIVDGEWRHDDSQTCMPDPLGNVNNWLLVKEPNTQPGPVLALAAETPAVGASMEVDHDLNLARGSHLPNSQTAERAHVVSPSEAEASRQRISEFLLRHSTAYDLLPQSGKVVTLDITLPVRQAFHALYEQGVATAPLWDSERHEFVGMLTASDFIVILRQFGSNGALLSEEEELDTHTIAAWKQEKLAIAGQDGSTSQKRPFLFVDPDCSLRQVADILLRHEVATVPVLNYNGSVPELLHLACLSGILKCICRHFRHVAGTLPLLSESIGALQRFQPLGTWIPELSSGSSKPVTMIRSNARLIMALALLLQVQVSALPIVDDDGCLLDVYCRSDITALAKDRAYAHRPLHEFTVAQALQIRNEVQLPGAAAGSRCQLCRRAETLRSVMERLALPGVRRLICVEEGTRRVEGIISLRDIFKFLLS